MYPALAMLIGLALGIAFGWMFGMIHAREIYSGPKARRTAQPLYKLGWHDARYEALKVAKMFSDENVDCRDDCLQRQNTRAALTRARQAQTADQIARAIQSLNPI